MGKRSAQEDSALRKPRTITQAELDTLSTAWGVINMQRQEVRAAGAHKASAAIARALKSLDGAIRHAQRLVNQQRNGEENG